mmetsp:Transcript_8270/g.12722  ORF Transcript_8270/g.12722 Transcript_8270/m.12722 type:complete len:413 (+) Transcript_8270:142-1380(+)|eukprot:CAMPEP_0178933552 /NCGR_PEP_ID=MMETSP0786-20121207/23338_1 /TAXON_ID=186022 /ORGANISM="Thalassionema frauenfeldii, Strain CCMP 1798" /LENGTH=412 /DNA_ID=CAMNT_0020611171 /DNA_START=73 /DNA_END=1311 /DNA_ORIENTATION=+
MIDSLPDQLIVEICMWVSPLDLLASVANVSNRFAVVIRDEDFWRLKLKMSNSLLSAPLNFYNDSKEEGEETILSSLTIMQLQRCCLLQQVLSPDELSGDKASLSPKRGTDNIESGDVVKKVHFEKENSKSNDRIVTTMKALEYGSLLPRKQTSLFLRQAFGSIRTCLASTTDFDNEFIENVISDSLTTKGNNQRRVWPLAIGGVGLHSSYWSSKPSEYQQSNETLLFTTKFPNTLISKVCIKPLLDPYLGDRAYTWKQISIKAYRLVPEETINLREENERLSEKLRHMITSSCCTIRRHAQKRSHHHPAHLPRNDKEAIHDLLRRHVPVYESPVFTTLSAKSVEWQQFDLPQGVLANAIVIQLIGKNSRQYDHSGYYACVENVLIQGIPLYKNLKEQEEWNSESNNAIIVLN